METALDLFCPACGVPLIPRLGCHSGCVKRAIHLQLRRFGTELACHVCGQRHVIRVTDIPGECLWHGASRIPCDDRLLAELDRGAEVSGDGRLPPGTGDARA